MKVKEIMSKNVVYAEVPGTRDELLRILAKEDISGVPIVKAGRKLNGIVTRKDLLRNPEQTQIALLMSRNPVIVNPNTNIKSAAKRMLKHRVHRLPVVKDRKLVGIVTPYDLLGVIEKLEVEKTIENMISRCIPIYENTPLQVALKILNLTEEYALPVIDDNAKLVGIITGSDLFKLSKLDLNNAVSDLGLGEDEDSWAWEGLRSVMKFYYTTANIDLPKDPVKKIMVKDVKTAVTSTPVKEVASVMKKCDIGQTPIINYRDDLCGMVHDLDLLSVLVE